MAKKTDRFGGVLVEEPEKKDRFGGILSEEVGRFEGTTDERLMEALRKAHEKVLDGDEAAKEHAKLFAAELRRRRALSEVPRETPPDPMMASAQQDVPIEELIAGSLPGRAVLGAGTLLSGPFQLGANVGDYIAEKMGNEPVVGKWVNEKLSHLDKMKKRGMAAQPLEIPYLPDAGGEGMDIAGGAGALAGGISAVAKIPIAAGLGGKMAQGAKMGAGFGAATPIIDPGSDGFGLEKADQVILGGGFGMVIPPSIAGGSKLSSSLRNLYRSTTDKGIERIVKNSLDEAAGTDSSKIIKLLRENKQLPGGAAGSGEVVAGVGEIAAPAGRAEFTALQRFSEKIEPTTFGRMTAAENKARINALKKISGNKEDLSLLKRFRKTTSKKDYEKAFSHPIKGDDELFKIADNPFFNLAEKDAYRLAKAEGKLPFKISDDITSQKNIMRLSHNEISKDFVLKENLSKYLHYVKLSLDKQLSKTGDLALSKTEKKAVSDIKNRLLSWLEERNPSYEVARLRYEQISKPINQMQVGRFLEKKLVKALDQNGHTGKQRADTYAQALREASKTIKGATGFKGHKELDDVLTSGQVRITQEVKENLKRRATYESLSTSGLDKAYEILSGQSQRLPDIGMFNPKYSMIKSIVNRLSGRVQGKSLKLLSEMMENPERSADLMERISLKDRKIIIQALKALPQAERAAIIGTSQILD